MDYKNSDIKILVRENLCGMFFWILGNLRTCCRYYIKGVKPVIIMSLYWNSFVWFVNQLSIDVYVVLFLNRRSLLDFLAWTGSWAWTSMSLSGFQLFNFTASEQYKDSAHWLCSLEIDLSKELTASSGSLVEPQAEEQV